ncbi:MAG: phage tail protein [Pigmentiphaga sp.]
MSTGQLAGGVAGGIAGALLIGSGVGIAGGIIIGGLLAGLSSAQKTVIEIGKRSDRTFQGSEYGGDIPRVYGTVGLSGSQIVWMENNQLKEVVKKKKSGGKGGPSTVTKTYSYYATFALMLCQGEIAGIRRIWCSDKLIYNAGSDDLETIIASNQAAKGWKLYRGTDDQLPDPRYEADVGVGNAPAFRGYTYIAFYDFALADYSNTLQAAQFKVELVSYGDYDKSVQLSYTPTFNKAATNGPAAVSQDSLFASVIYVDGDNYVLRRYRDGAIDRIQFIAKYNDPTHGIGYPVCCIGESKYAIRRADGTLFIEDMLFNKTFGTPLYAGKIDGKYYCFERTSDGASIIANILDPLSTGSTNASVIKSVTVGKDCVADGNGYFHFMHSTSGSLAIDRYDMDLNLVGSYSLPISGIGNTSSAYFDGQLIWAFTGSKVLSFSLDGSQSDSFTVSYATYGTIDPGRLYVVDGIITLLLPGVSSNAGSVGQYQLFRISEDKPTLASIIEAECSLSALIDSSDLDTSLLTQTVNGYRVSGGTIRSVIEPLQGGYPFDVVPSGYKIKFVPRGQSSVLTIPWEDLAATDGTDIGDSLPYSREMDSQLPQKVTITALSSTREYASATQSYERLNTSAVNIEQRDIPLVLSDDEIAQMSEKLLFLRWLERDDFEGPSLPPSYLALEPADVVQVQTKFATLELRLTEVNYESDGRLTCKAKLNNAAIYTSNAVGAFGPGPSGTIGLPGATIWLPMDIPVVDETLQDEPGISTAATGETDGWPGSVLVRSNDSGQTYSEIQGYSGKGTLGYARAALAVNSGALVDQSSLVVDLISGELESITFDQMITGANYAAYGKDQRWEIVRFQNAVLQSDGSYLVSGFIRGDKGTEWATGLHQPGDWFVLLDDADNVFITVPVESMGLERLYRAVTAGQSIDSASDQAFTYRGVNLKPLSPAYAYSARDSSGNITAYAIRRSRYTNSWWVTGVSGPVGEATEAYEADVMSGSTVKRTLTSSNGTFTYSATDQTTDFGSSQANITLRIYQLSATVGRGYPLEVTL